MKHTLTLIVIGIQEEYIETLNSGIARWSHLPTSMGGGLGGHANRIASAAYKKAVKSLRKLDYTDQKQIDELMCDAGDMAAVIRDAKEVE